MNIYKPLLFSLLLTTLVSTVFSQTAKAADYDIKCTQPDHNTWDWGDSTKNPRTFEQCDENGGNDQCTRDCKLILTDKNTPNGYVQQSKGEECDMGWKSDLAEWKNMCTAGQIKNDLVLNGAFDKDRICKKTVRTEELELIRSATQSACSDIDTTVTTAGAYKCGPRRMCGNGKKDADVGEACDPLDPNSTVACSKHCAQLVDTDPFKDHKASLPYFSKDNIEYWKPARPITFTHEGSGTITDPSTSDNIKITNQGRVIEAEMERSGGSENRKAYSGVFLSNVHFDFEKDPDQVIDIHLLLQSQDPSYNNPWDNDYFGLVFGMNKGDATINNGPSYLLLPWRENRITGASSNERIPITAGTCGAGHTVYQKPMGPNTLHEIGGGLHLYQIQNRPSYQELWTMHNCTGLTNIKRIPLEEKDHDWNKLERNPLFYANPYYIAQYIDFSRGTNGWTEANKRVHSVQMRARFTKDTLEVWVNGQKAIDIEKPSSGHIKGYTSTETTPSESEVLWPTKGQWGFYILAYDNFRADFRGVAPQFRNERQENDPNCAGDFCNSGTTITQVPDDIEEWRCDRCGDGIVQAVDANNDPLEACDFSDDTNYRNDKPGCTESCKADTGWVCNPYENYCIEEQTTVDASQADTELSGTVRVTGGPGVATNHVPAYIEITDKNGVTVCTGQQSSLPNWTYTVDSTCKLEPGKTYKVKIAPIDGTNSNGFDGDFTVPDCGDGEVQDGEHCDFGTNPPADQGCSDKCTAADDWTCNSANYCVNTTTTLEPNKSTDGEITSVRGEITVTGPGANVATTGTVKITDANGDPVTGCVEKNVTTLPKWTYTIEPGCDLEPGTYTITVTTDEGEIAKTTFTVKDTPDDTPGGNNPGGKFPITGEVNQDSTTIGGDISPINGNQLPSKVTARLTNSSGQAVEGCDDQEVSLNNGKWSMNLTPECKANLKSGAEYTIDFLNNGTSIDKQTFIYKTTSASLDGNPDDANTTGILVGGCSHTPALPSIPTLVFTTLGFAWMRRRKTK